jgi:ribosomal protein L16 Arg81 hydroxylase
MKTNLTWLISPHDFTTFQDEYWSRAALRVSRQNSLYYQALYSETDLEESLFIASQTSNAVEALTEGKNPYSVRGHAKTLAVLKEKGSLRIPSIQRFSLKLAKFARELEQVISAPININLYMSPFSGKKALGRHFDTHDVFVMQLFGSKRWRLFAPHAEFPMESLPLLPRESVRDMKQYRLETQATLQKASATATLTDEFVLHPGDFLYLPRGVWHEADSEPGDLSCHLTAGIAPITYSDLLTAALAKVTTSEPALRQALPLGFATNPSTELELEAKVSETMGMALRKMSPRAALSDLRAVFHRSHRSAFENRLLRQIQFDDLDSIQIDSWIHVREGLVIGVDKSTEPAQFLFGPERFLIEKSFVGACQFMCEQQRFTPAMLPEQLTTEQKLVLVKQLIIENVLLPSAEEGNDAIPEEAHDSSLRWVPSQLSLRDASLQWISLRENDLREPFFHQTVKRRQMEDPTSTRKTDLSALLRVKMDLPPAGFIFHVSRCGSTLLANGLRRITGSMVVSEPQPVSELLAGAGRGGGRLTQKHRQMLQGLLWAHGQRHSQAGQSLVVKLTSWNLLYIEQIRDLFPAVPCLILVRHPLDVAASCLGEPPGWLPLNERKMTNGPLSILDFDAKSGRTPERICSRILGEYFKIAHEQVDGMCRILDYEDLNPEAIRQIAKFFEMSGSAEIDLEAVSEVFSIYSKDPEGLTLFKPDSEWKRASASDSLRHEVECLAMPYYSQLMNGSSAENSMMNGWQGMSVRL